MSLSRVQSLRKVSILSIIAAVAILIAGTWLPRLWVAVLLLAFLSIPFVLWNYIWPREARRHALEDIVTVRSPEAMLKLRLAKGEITQEQFEKIIVSLQETPSR